MDAEQRRDPDFDPAAAGEDQVPTVQRRWLREDVEDGDNTLANDIQSDGEGDDPAAASTGAQGQGGAPAGKNDDNDDYENDDENDDDENDDDEHVFDGQELEGDSGSEEGVDEDDEGAGAQQENAEPTHVRTWTCSIMPSDPRGGVL